MKSYLSQNHIQHNLSNLSILTFEVTDACNLKCKYCAYGEFYNDYDNRTSKMMPIEYAKHIIHYLLPYWSSNWNVSSDQNVYIGFYGGEPLLNMTFIQDVINYILQLPIKNRHFTYAMTTNALLLDKYNEKVKHI